jgi:ABC-type transporter Mla subunit MlaD
MASKATYLRVGTMLILGTAAAVWLVLFLNSNQIRRGENFETYFKESVQGLDVGAPVKYRGVTLGQVSGIGLAAAEYANGQPSADSGPTQLVMVRFVLDPKRLASVPDPSLMVERGLRTRLASQGLTGLAYVELDFVDPKRFPAEEVPWKPRDSYIPSMPSTISQVQSAAQDLFAKLQNLDIDRLAKSVQQVLDDAHTQLSSGDAHQALSEMAMLLKAARGSVEKADLPALAADLRATSASLRGTLEGKPTQQMLASAAQAADRLAAAAARLPALIAALETTVRRVNTGTSDLQSDLAPTLRDAKAAAANLRETTEMLRRYPSSVLLGGPPPRDGGSR